MDSSKLESNPSLLQELNSIASLVVHGLMADNDGRDLAFVIPRDNYDKLKQAFTTPNGTPNSHYFPYFPPALTSRPLPPDGDVELHLQLGACISDGPRHLVFEVSVWKPETLPFSIPPLILKVAKELEGRHLAEEAAMYNFLQRLQGVLIPRCYGYFRSRVNLMECVVTPWDPEVEFPRELDEFRMPNPLASLNVLLIEKVGGHVPTRWSTPRDFLQELLDMDKDLLECGVAYTDWRYKNVMLAPQSPPGLPSLPSPFRNRIYRYRLIDLEDAVRTNTRPECLLSDHAEEIEAMVQDMRGGDCTIS